MAARVISSLVVSVVLVLGFAPLAASAAAPSPTQPGSEPVDGASGGTAVFVAIAIVAALVVVIGFAVVLRRGLKRDR